MALDRALKMPLEERQLRMFQLKKRERRMDVDAWVKSFLLEMDSIHGIPGKESNILFFMSVWLKMTSKSGIKKTHNFEGFTCRENFYLDSVDTLTYRYCLFGPTKTYFK
jgi:hypothetical protein